VIGRILCAVSLFGIAAPVYAQTPAAGAFVDGVLFLGIEQRSYTEFSGSDTPATGQNPSDQVLGGGFAIGTFLGPRASARVEVALLGETAIHEDSQIGAIETSTIDRFLSGQSFSVLAGYHPPTSGRVQYAYVAGVAFVRLREEFTQVLRREATPPFSPAVQETVQGKQVQYGPTVIVGMDAAVRLGRHIDLVPQIRVTSASGLSVRPGVSVRWRQ
jgi:hypothetical protein